jgi:CRISPR/Cas system CSM-associated protein Csm3 (group 7 of RAMP superfamily)
LSKKFIKRIRQKIVKRFSIGISTYRRYGEVKPLKKLKKTLDEDKIGKKDEKDEKLGKKDKKDKKNSKLDS